LLFVWKSLVTNAARYATKGKEEKIAEFQLEPELVEIIGNRKA
jgi:hypothetical protein